MQEAKIATVSAVCCGRVLLGRERAGFHGPLCRFCLGSSCLLWDASWGGREVFFGRGEAVRWRKSVMVSMVRRLADDVGSVVDENVNELTRLWAVGRSRLTSQKTTAENMVPVNT